MANIVVYVKCKRRVDCSDVTVYMKDIGELLCEDRRVLHRCEEVKIFQFTNQKYEVVHILQVIEKLTQACPGIQVESLGEKEMILLPSFPAVSRRKDVLKLPFACAVCFFGTGFSIMAFQNDIGINGVFDTIYKILMGEKPRGVNALQLGYAFGLFLGILLFFNHVGKKKNSSDPTPIQVSLQNYETDIEDTLVQMAETKAQKGE